MAKYWRNIWKSKIFNFSQKVGKYLLNKKKKFVVSLHFLKWRIFWGFCTQTDRENGILGALYCSSYCMENWRIFWGSARKSGARKIRERLILCKRQWILFGILLFKQSKYKLGGCVRNVYNCSAKLKSRVGFQQVPGGLFIVLHWGGAVAVIWSSILRFST